MNEDYMPTTEDIRHYVCWYRDENAEHYSKEREIWFDRWLVEHDRRVAYDAVDNFAHQFGL